jgi:pimeloyl-ACP methyl ester carboxylesterase
MRCCRAFVTLTVLLTTLCGCNGDQGSSVTTRRTPVGKAEYGEITYKTADGWTIYGDFQPANRATKAVILLHQRMGQASDWAPLIDKLNGAGIATLAIDQRGAGRSQGRENGENAPWDTTADIQAAVEWLAAHGIKSIGLAGASYGANNALIYAAGHPDIRAVALLSPGTDYHGLKVEPAASSYKGALLVVSAKDDVIMDKGLETISHAFSGVAESKVYPGEAHGTQLLTFQPDSIDVLTAFFKSRL